jgi:spermidine/putrescine transport system permease protein
VNRSLVNAYGRSLTFGISAIVALWLLGLVLVPQAAMIKLSLWSVERNEDLGAKINRLYASLGTLDFDRAAEQDSDRKRELDAKAEALKGEIAALEAQEKQPSRIYGLQNYTRMSALHAYVFARTIFLSILVTLVALAVCYPAAVALAFASTRRRAVVLLVCLIVPYAMNELLRVYAWLMILDYRGLLNALLTSAGLVEARTPIPFLEYPGSLFAALVYTYVLFMVFPIANTLEALDRNQIEAARDLGGSTLLIHRRIIIPAAKPGIAVGCMMTFMLAVGSYAVPQIMTRGTGGDWFSQLVYRQFFESNNWNVGSAYAFALMLVSLLIVGGVLALARVRLGDFTR